MVIALTEPAQEADNPIARLNEESLQLDIQLSITLGITAEQARRKLTRFLIDEVSLLIHPQAPLLVLAAANSIFWRFPLLFSMGPRGQLGQVGQVDVDAQTGEILLDDHILAEIKTHARILARSAPLSANN